MCIRFINKGGIDTSDATAIASDILKDKTAYVDGEKITGTLETGEYNTVLNTTFSSSNTEVRANIKSLPVFTIQGTSASYMFQGLSGLLTIPQIDTSNITYMTSMFSLCKSITAIPQLDTSNVVNMARMFEACENLVSIPLLNTSKVTDMNSMFSACFRLETVPILDTNKVTNFGSMFQRCNALSDESLNNILAMCINATSYTGTKKLTTLNIYSSTYPASKIESLSNYQAFINAGWTTGY